ncbi:hypothetical protein [Rhodospirillum rubrum]|nr:hypothetical protein [Rhodospirillum rubrum]AEO46902.1 hypothetical protein F11_02160 [Rhodospirillum rubrum F11]QXG80916.1 hypothetical protein KUL73_02225 [Rhodospirillum rubrum]
MIRKTILATTAALVLSSPLAFAGEQSLSDQKTEWTQKAVWDHNGWYVGKVTDVTLKPGGFARDITVTTERGQTVVLDAGSFENGTGIVVTKATEPEIQAEVIQQAASR